MERFKAIDEILVGDSRSTGWALRNNVTGETRPYTIEDHHQRIAEVELTASTPEDVRDSFLTARHLALYSWFVYRFGMPCQLQAYSALEFALRIRLKHTDDERPPGLKALLRKAIEGGLVDERRINVWPGHRMDLTFGGTRPYADGDWLRGLPEYAAHFRNDLAHGSFTLNTEWLRTLALVADIVNQLFPDEAPAPAA